MSKPELTDFKFTNNSGKTLELHGTYVWQGNPQAYGVPTRVDINRLSEYKHDAANTASVVSLEYQVGTDCVLVVSWSNEQNSKKVHAEILPLSGVVHLNQIKTKFLNSSSQFDTGIQCGYRCVLDIDTTGSKPEVRATLMKAA